MPTITEEPIVEEQIEEQVSDLPEERPGGPGGGTGPYRVILYNDEWHSCDAVALQVQKATGHSLEVAWQIMLEAHHRGRAICYRGERDQCHRVARVLREIRLQCEVDSD